MPHYPSFDYSGGITVQAVFFEDRDDVLFNYADTHFEGGPWFADNGQIASVGIQVGPTVGTQFSYYKPSVTSGTSLLWRTAEQDFSLVLTTASQTVFPGQTATFEGTVQSLYGFSSPVTVACSSPAPANCSGQTVAATTAGARFKLTASDSSIGQYAFDIVANRSNDSTIVHRQSATLNVVDYTISAPAPMEIDNGATASTSMQVSSLGPFSAGVKLSCTGSRRVRRVHSHLPTR